MMFITRLPRIKVLACLFLLALALRLFRLGSAVLKEDEFSAVKAAAYIDQCRLDPENCRYQPTVFKDKWLALFTANETVPNPLAEIYLWDFIRGQASEVHHSRAWPYLYGVAGIYKFFNISEFSSRLVSALAGSLMVLAGYWVSRSLLYSSLLAISFPLIDFSRNARFYSLYILVYLFLVGAIHRRRWLLAGLLFSLAYQLQLLTLILPLGLLIYAFSLKQKPLLKMLIGGLIVFGGIIYFAGANWISQFLTITFYWQYLNWWWLAVLSVLLIKRDWFWLAIIGSYFTIFVFFSRPDPAGAYLVALWPLGLLALLSWRRWLTVVVSFVVVINFGLKIPYLYFNRDGRADIPAAYAPLIDNWQAGDKIFAIQLRDYYLQELPSDTPIIDLQKEPAPEFTGSGYVVWEEEKTHKLDPNTLAFIRSNFRYMGGYGVEIYSFGK